MLHEKALKTLCEPDLWCGRILNDEESAMFDLIQSNLSTKLNHGKILSSFHSSICRIVDVLHLTPWSTNWCHVNNLRLLSFNHFHCLPPTFGCKQIVTCSQIYWRSYSKSLHGCYLTEFCWATKHFQKVDLSFSDWFPHVVTILYTFWSYKGCIMLDDVVRKIFNSAGRLRDHRTGIFGRYGGACGRDIGTG